MAHKQLAGCVILDKQGRILLLHRNTAKRQQWEIPGGKLEPGETNRQAAIREITEELDIKVKIIQKLGGKEFVEDGHTLSYTWFLAKIMSGTPRIMEPEIFDSLEYFSGAHLQKILESLSENTQNFLNNNDTKHMLAD